MNTSSKVAHKFLLLDRSRHPPDVRGQETQIKRKAVDGTASQQLANLTLLVRQVLHCAADGPAQSIGCKPVSSPKIPWFISASRKRTTSL